MLGTTDVVREKGDKLRITFCRESLNLELNLNVDVSPDKDYEMSAFKSSWDTLSSFEDFNARA